MPRYIGLDVGDRRIGVAISDPLGVIATPLLTINRRTPDLDVRSIVDLGHSYGITGFVLGLPISLDGNIGEQARKVQVFAEVLGDVSSVPVGFVDERYTSAEAERIIREKGEQPSKQKARIDAIAAAVILQEYLDTFR